jgi:hypothetical protein
VVRVTATLATSPEPDETLVRFYRLVRPAGPGWAAVQRLAGVGPSSDRLTHALAGWVLGCAVVYAALFGAGSALDGLTAQATVLAVVFVASRAGLIRVLRA